MVASFHRRLGPALRTAALACAAMNWSPPALAAEGPDAPPSSSPAAARELEYLIGSWDIVATTPGTGETARYSYEVRPLLGTVWISGHGRSVPPGEESRDIWGRDSASGELMRIIFDGSGTYAVVRSRGWNGTRLVLEGDARSAGGVVRVRETIERISDGEFIATWEAWRNGAWSPYSIERVTRRPASASRS